MTIIKEVLQIAHHLSIWSTLKKVREWVTFRFFVKALSENREINFPHVNTKVVCSGSKEEFSINNTTDGCDFSWMCDESHGVVWITIEGKFDDAYYFFSSGVS